MEIEGQLFFVLLVHRVWGRPQLANQSLVLWVESFFGFRWEGFAMKRKFAVIGEPMLAPCREGLFKE